MTVAINEADGKLGAVFDCANIVNIKFNSEGLVPAIVQDLNGEVLMLAWLNREALELTLTTGRVTYWSRSRAKLWRKGDTSGHKQLLQAAFYDCDADTLLFQVVQTGSACHNGTYSCFASGKFEKLGE